MNNLTDNTSSTGEGQSITEYVLDRETLRDVGIDIDFFPGAVFLLSKHESRLLKVSQKGIDSFSLTPEILDNLVQGELKKVFYPAGLKRMKPMLAELIESDSMDMVAATILEYRGKSHPRFVHVSLRLIQGMDALFGLAHYIPSSAWPSNVVPTRARRFRTKTLSRFNMLTSREREVLQLVVYGLKNADIANRLDISINTVKTHRKNVHLKLDIAHPGDLIKYAVAFDLVEF